jgi:hypothetical protein
MTRSVHSAARKVVAQGEVLIVDRREIVLFHVMVRSVGIRIEEDPSEKARTPVVAITDVPTRDELSDAELTPSAVNTNEIIDAIQKNISTPLLVGTLS